MNCVATCQAKCGTTCVPSAGVSLELTIDLQMPSHYALQVNRSASGIEGTQGHIMFFNPDACVNATQIPAHYTDFIKQTAKGGTVTQEVVQALQPAADSACGTSSGEQRSDIPYMMLEAWAVTDTRSGDVFYYITDLDGGNTSDNRRFSFKMDGSVNHLFPPKGTSIPGIVWSGMYKPATATSNASIAVTFRMQGTSPGTTSTSSSSSSSSPASLLHDARRVMEMPAVWGTILVVLAVLGIVLVAFRRRRNLETDDALGDDDGGGSLSVSVGDTTVRV